MHNLHKSTINLIMSNTCYGTIHKLQRWQDFEDCLTPFPFVDKLTKWAYVVLLTFDYPSLLVNVVYEWPHEFAAVFDVNAVSQRLEGAFPKKKMFVF